jgi:hypothetical protein
MVVWVIAVAVEISAAQVTLDDGRARRVAALDVTVPSGASVVLFAIPAEHEALLTLRDRGEMPWGAAQRLPFVQRPKSAWQASSFRCMDPALRGRLRARRQDDELMPDSEWFASQLREESTWTYELQDMPFAVHVLAPTDWCVRVGWGLGLGTEELLVVYLDDAWFETSGRGGRRVES